MSPRFIERIGFYNKISDPGAVRAALWLFAYALVPTIPVVVLLPLFLRTDGQRETGWFQMLVVNPVIGTLMLGAIIIHLMKTQKEHHAVMMAALVLGAFYSLNSVLWGFAALGALLIQGFAFTHLYRTDRQRAFAVPMLAHALHNALLLLIWEVF